VGILAKGEYPGSAIKKFDKFRLVGFFIHCESNGISSRFSAYLIQGEDNIITNCGAFNNKLMGLRNMIAIKNESERLTVTNSFFTNATGTDRCYEGNPNTVMWQNNSIEKDEISESYFSKQNK
jgi:hypothetical protein